MNMILTHIGFWLMMACAVTLVLVNRRLGKRVERYDRLYHHCAEALADDMVYKLAVRTSITYPAQVEERTDGLTPCFVICRCVGDFTIEILHIGYNPLDPDDREYKRIHAEEVAEKLNERV